VYIQPNYSREHKPYHFIFVFGGKEYQDKVPTPTILNNLIPKRKIPPIILALLDNTLNREIDYHVIKRISITWLRNSSLG